MCFHEDDYNRSLAIAKLLGELWNVHKTSFFREYVADTYQQIVDELPVFHCVYVAETFEGDLERGPVLGIVKYQWQVDEGGIVKLGVPKYKWPAWLRFYETPLIVFYTFEDSIILREMLGQEFWCLKRGNLDLSSGELQIRNLTVIDKWDCGTKNVINDNCSQMDDR